MVILGIDPGTTAIGYAVIEDKKNDPVLKTAGLFRVLSSGRENRWRSLERELSSLIRKWRPSALAIERIFFSRNQKTALAVAETRGAILLITSLAGLDAYEYTPLEVKKSVTGAGNADKLQVEKLIKLTLHGARDLSASDDVFDAIAIALTCFYRRRSSQTESDSVKLD